MSGRINGAKIEPVYRVGNLDDPGRNYSPVTCFPITSETLCKKGVAVDCAGFVNQENSGSKPATSASA